MKKIKQSADETVLDLDEGVALITDEGGEIDANSAEIIEESAVIPEAAAETVSETTDEKSGAPEKSGVWVYIGPTVRGVITNGGIFFGTKQSVLDALPRNWRDYPQIERLIVSDTALAHAKQQIYEGKGGVNVAYNAIAAAVQNAAKEV